MNQLRTMFCCATAGCTSRRVYFGKDWLVKQGCVFQNCKNAFRQDRTSIPKRNDAMFRLLLRSAEGSHDKDVSP